MSKSHRSRFPAHRSWFVLPGLLLWSGPALQAGEIIVQNDSFQSGQSAYVVGNFVPGEHAGARFAAPCNGRIVAVQIGWLSGEPQEFPSVERAIHIFDGSTFPTPGAEWAFLEAPVLTSGYLNEFRYLDEGQTVPLDIPILSGQQFYVTLEFDNATDVGNGGPSVFRDLNGCQAGKNVLFAIPGGWQNFCNYLAGDLVIRAVIDCEAGGGTGACCLANGSCTTGTPSQCSSQGGAYMGDGTNCASVNCQGQTGACCFESTGGCLNLTASNCANAGGIFRGPGTNCGTTVCFPRGACCLPDGSCADNLSPEECSLRNGTFQGDETTCGGTNCPEPQGACCFSNGFCLLLTEGDCATAGGAWRGFGTDCVDANGDGTAEDCVAGCQPCDTNCDGSINQFDIQAFLDVMQGAGGCSGCSGDANDDGSLNQFDIQGFVDCLG